MRMGSAFVLVPTGGNNKPMTTKSKSPPTANTTCLDVSVKFMVSVLIQKFDTVA
jgi:hypothetical protein